MDYACCEWKKLRNKAGYGVISVNGEQVLVHRWIWTVTHGPIPQGMCVLHRCDNPPCFEPTHLFLGTRADNNRDMVQKGRQNNQQKTHCPKGHAYTPENTYIIPSTGGRMCRTCTKERIV